MSESNNKPRIRFKGFTDAWEQRALDDTATFNPSSILPERFQYVDLESVVGGNLIHSREETKGRAPSRAQRLAMVGDVFYQLVRPYQRNNFLFKIPSDLYVFSTGYAQIRPAGPGTFLLALLNSDTLVRTVMDRATGTSYPAIAASTLGKIESHFPSHLEQELIGDITVHIENLITLHQRKSSKLQELKKSLLEKMFPLADSDVPELRFNGFTDAWEQRELSSLLTSIPSRTFTRADLTEDVGAVQCIHYGDILVRYGPILDCTREQIPYVKGVSSHPFRDIQLRDGDIVFADAAEDSSVGKAVEISGVSDTAVIGGLHTIAFRSRHLVARNYLGYYLNSDVYRTQLLAMMQGTKVLSLSRRSLKVSRIATPSTDSEQSSVGSLLEKIGWTITLHQRKLEKLENIKRALLESMFV